MIHGHENNDSDITSLMSRIHQTAVDHGFWDSERNDGEMIALMHSELSEGLEALRKGVQSDHIEGFGGIEEEMADVIFRVLDFCAGRKLHIIEAIAAKMKFNEGRPHKHGKAF